jgi:hypothetical protein
VPLTARGCRTPLKFMVLHVVQPSTLSVPLSERGSDFGSTSAINERLSDPQLEPAAGIEALIDVPSIEPEASGLVAPFVLRINPGPDCEIASDESFSHEID